MNKASLKDKKKRKKWKNIYNVIFPSVIQVRKKDWRTFLDVCTECRNHACWGFSLRWKGFGSDPKESCGCRTGKQVARLVNEPQAFKSLRMRRWICIPDGVNAKEPPNKKNKKASYKYHKIFYYLAKPVLAMVFRSAVNSAKIHAGEEKMAQIFNVSTI